MAGGVYQAQPLDVFRFCRDFHSERRSRALLVVIDVSTASSTMKISTPSECWSGWHTIHAKQLLHSTIAFISSFPFVKNCMTTRWQRLEASVMQKMLFNMVLRYVICIWQCLTISHALCTICKSILNHLFFSNSWVVTALLLSYGQLFWAKIFFFLKKNSLFLHFKIAEFVKMSKKMNMVFIKQISIWAKN